MTKRAVIIGAGGAGLAAMHAMQQAGFEVTAFEQHTELGGVWATTRYPLTMHAKSFSYRFHDFPALASRDESATQDEVRAYFEAYARAKGIADRIVYGTRVERIERRDGRCSITTSTGVVDSDVVICASGYANSGRPHVPSFGPSRVRVVHSSEVSPEIVDDIVANRRKVVVLGAGKSAHEILWLLRGQQLTWVYVKSLWSTSYEKLYSNPLREPWNAALYGYYMAMQVARRRWGYGPMIKRLQSPLVRAGYLINPLEPDSDICMNRGAILKADRFAYLQTVPAIKSRVTGLGNGVQLEDRELEADYLICATGYDRAANLPELVVDGVAHPLAKQHGFYLHLVDPAVPEVSVLSAAILYPQHLLGFSLAAQWLARFHQGRLKPQPTTAEMTRWIERRAEDFGPWCSGDYLSGGVPYAHQRDKDVLPTLFAQMGISPSLARTLVLRGTDERRFSEVCDRVARALG